MSLSSKLLGLDTNSRKPLDIALTWEGNYWDDQDIHDCCDLDFETCEILSHKIARLLLDTSTNCSTQNSSPILILLPTILQLPLSILAAHRANKPAIIVNPLTASPHTIHTIVSTHKPSIVVTADATWQRQSLIDIKRTLVDAIPDSVQVIVIRHVAPNSGVPPPAKNLPARRPSYLISLDLRNGRDIEWAVSLADIPAECRVETRDWRPDDVAFIFESESLTTRQLIARLEESARDLPRVENTMLLDYPDTSRSLTDLLLPWFMGNTLTLYEGPLDYPDSSRLSQIIQKHNVNSLIARSSSYPIPNPEYLKFFSTKSLKHIESNAEIVQSLAMFK